MPAILDGDEAIRKWLDFAEVPTQEAVKLIQPTEHITFYPVSTLVSNSRNDTPECLTPIELGLKQVRARARHESGLPTLILSEDKDLFCL